MIVYPRITKTLLLLFCGLSTFFCFGQHPLDKKFEEAMNREKRETPGNSALISEMLSDKMIEDWDKELNRVYNELLSKLPNYKKTQLTDAQRKWIEYRDLNFELLEDIDQEAMYPQPRSREMLFIRQRVLELIDINERYQTNEPIMHQGLPPENNIDNNALTEIINELSECYFFASKMFELDGVDLNLAKANGNKHYNKAYNLFLKLQTDQKTTLPREKAKVIYTALSTYATIFNNKEAMAQNWKPDVEFIKTNLEKFPNDITQIEKDYTENITRVILGSMSTSEVLFDEGENWCLWEIIGDDTVWVEGYLPNNGYGKYIIESKQLPIFLGSQNKFILTAPLNDIHLIFKPCKEK